MFVLDSVFSRTSLEAGAFGGYDAILEFGLARLAAHASARAAHFDVAIRVLYQRENTFHDYT